ncbi:MAG: FG-GAP-like repeat-containing protein [Tunicatimonas sp.]
MPHHPAKSPCYSAQKILFGCLLWLSTISTVRAQTPYIRDISQSHGTVNEVITIRGSGFGNSASQIAVFFGAAASESVTVEDTKIQATVPAGATSSSISVINITTGLMAFSPEVFTLSYDGFEFDKTQLEAPETFVTEGDELYNFCVCDFNRDGRNDIVTTHTATQKAAILQNNTTTVDAVSFTRPDPASIKAGKTRWVRCGDLNGDGMPDLVFTFSNQSSNKNRIVVYQNIGIAGQDIAFESESDATFYAIKGTQGGRMDIRDLDGDGKPEVVVADLNGNGGVSIFQNTSSLSDISFQAQPLLPFADHSINPVGVAGVDVDDLDGDGLPDLVASNGGQTVLAFTNTSTSGTIAFSAPITLASSEIRNLKLGDMDGDGKTDVVVSSEDHVGVFRNVTDTVGVAFTREAKFNAGGPKLLYLGLDLADMDGNGLPDVVIANENSFPKLVSVILNNSAPGTLRFDKSEKILTERTRTARGADFNGDGKPDLAYTDIDTDKIVIRLNRNCIQPVLDPVNGLSVCDVLPFELKATKGIGLTYDWEVSDDGINFLPVAGAIGDSYTTGLEKHYRVGVSSIQNGVICSRRVSNVVKVVRPDGFVPDRPVIINPNPATPYCFGETVTIEAENINAEFVWADPQGVVIPDASTNVLTIENITAAQAGAYTVYVQASAEQGGCISDDATATIKVSEPPAIQISANQPPVLLNEQTSVTLSIPVAESHTYVWFKNEQIIGGANTNALTVSEAGTYVATITNELSCVRESPPFVVADGQPEIPATVCQNQEENYRVLPDSLNGVAIRYRWNFGDGGTLEGNSVNYGYSEAGSFTVAVEVISADNQVSSLRQQAITVFPSPVFTLAPEGKANLCPGETVTLVGSEGFATYTWNNGETTPRITASQAGVYALTVTTDDGCTLTKEIEVRDVPNPEPVIEASTERVSLGDTLQLQVSGGDTYLWQPAQGLSDTTIANPIARPLVTTTYTCKVTNNEGCSVTAEYIVYVDRSLDVVPDKIFSPNADGQNDTWRIEKMELYPDCRMTLFNRQGVQVFKRENYTNDNPWDGSNNGQFIPAGVYFYLIDCGDEAGQQTGSVTIVR